MEEFDPLLLSRRVARALSDGVDAAELRTRLWERDLNGVVRPAFCEFDEVTTRLSNAVALMSSNNALGGWAALRAQGNMWFDGTGHSGQTRKVPLLCLPGSQLRPREDIVPWRGSVHPDEILELGRYLVSTMARAAFDEMCRARRLRDAVVTLDMATSTTSQMSHTTHTAVDHVVRSHHKVRGIVRARAAMPLSSARSASPGETRTRLIAELDAGMDDLSVNQPVFDLSGNLLGVADLLDEQTGLVIESDGQEFHAGSRTKDNHRQERFERALMTVCRVTGEDHGDRFRTAARMTAARRDASRVTERRWTTERPDWWSTWKHAPRWE